MAEAHIFCYFFTFADVILKGFTSYLQSVLFPPEYARYLHRKMDTRLENLDVDEDLCDHLKDGWLKSLPFDIQVS